MSEHSQNEEMLWVEQAFEHVDDDILLGDLIRSSAVQQTIRLEGYDSGRIRIYGIERDGEDVKLRLTPPPSHDDPGAAPGREVYIRLGEYDDADTQSGPKHA